MRKPEPYIIYNNTSTSLAARATIGLAALLLLIASPDAHAQKATVRVTIEPSEIQIGEQAIINLEIIAPLGRLIQFPIYEDTIVTGIEVLGMLPTDTVLTEVMRINQRYVVTSFDSTLYHIPFMSVLDGNDTIRSNDVGLKVISPQLSDSTLAHLDRLKKQETDSIDFVKLEIRDPYAEAILDPPFVWKDYLDYLLYALVAVLVLVLALVLLIVYLNKRRKGYYFKPKEVIPPHIVALKELEQLKDKHLCQQGLEKEYYTRLSEIVRNYIDQRYLIGAPEMISEDIVQAIREVVETNSSIDNLEQILTVADLVKFAKYVPLPNENDLTLVNATLFVNQTKMEEQAKTDEKGKPIVADTQKEQAKEQAKGQAESGATEQNNNDAK